MPRISRNSINSKFIHLVTQGIDKEYIFQEDKFKEKYIENIHTNVKAFDNTKIIAFCVMDNHAHLLVYANDIQELSKMMSKVNTSYAMYYNKMVDRVGYVFKNRYYTQQIIDLKHLYNTLAYIHKNPVKAKMVENESDYKFSSYTDYIENNISEDVINLVFNSKDYLNQFYFIHRNFREENIIDIKEDKKVAQIKMKNIIIDFCKKYDSNLEYIRKDNYLLTQLLKEIKNNCDVSNKYISDCIEIGKNRITTILKK